MKFTLKSVAAIMNDNTPDNIMVYVNGCWEDYGAGMWWDTIIVERKTTNHHRDSYQALTPNAHYKLMNGEFTLDDIQELIDMAIKLYGGK